MACRLSSAGVQVGELPPDQEGLRGRPAGRRQAEGAGARHGDTTLSTVSACLTTLGRASALLLCPGRKT